ncbi:MAG TPA: HNH endonuclease, partial [Pirellulaceae bacterium]|nr:HNH endonuclease [Pirellulaceae bacterium]
MTARISDEVRERVAAHFQQKCTYCQSPLFLMPGAGTVEHIEPRSAQGSDDESNLCLSCYRSNLRKATRIAAVDPRTRKKTPLFHPRQQTWQDHFRWSADP